MGTPAEALPEDNAAAASTAAAAALAALGAARGHAHGLGAPGVLPLPSSAGAPSPPLSANLASFADPAARLSSYRPRKQPSRQGDSGEPAVDEMLVSACLTTFKHLSGMWRGAGAPCDTLRIMQFEFQIILLQI